MFKTVELGAWYRVHWEGKSVFGQVLERHRNSYTFRYADEKGKVRSGTVGRSDITGRLGDHLIPDLEAAITPPAKRRKTTATKAKVRNAITPGDWHRFQYEGKIVPGVVYRVEGDDCTMFFLYGGVPLFVTLPRKKIGTQEEGLTAVFKEEIGKNPKYLEEWVSTAKRLGTPAQDQPAPEPTKKMPRPRKAPTTRKKAKPSKGQGLLFPE